MKLTQNALVYLLYQRANYRHPVYKVFSALGLKHLYLHKVIPSILERSRIRKVEKVYHEEISAYINKIRPFLPEQCKVVLDIGCGIGGINVLLNNFYSGKIKENIMLDRTELTREYYTDYKNEAAACNSLIEAKLILEINGVKPETINLIDINTQKFPVNQKIDLCISSLAWGYHFPIKTYLDQVRSISHPETVLIIDVRKGTEDFNELKNIFGKYDVIIDEKKHQTIACKLCQA